MSTLIYSIINVAYLTTGRRLYALKAALTTAGAMNLTPLVTLIQAAIAHDTETVAMEDAWARSKQISTARGRSRELDDSIDAILGSISSILSANIRLFDASHPLAKASQEILSQLFPEGVQPIITLPFEEQLVKNQTIIDRLSGDLDEAVAVTNLPPYVTQLESLNTEFRDQLAKSKSKEISYDTLEAARDEGNLYIRRIVALILGTFNDVTDTDAENRRALLAPFLEQADRIRRTRKGRRSPLDVDPETGEEQVTEESVV